jgi:hypothetical protein
MISLFLGAYGRPIEIPLLLDGDPWDISAGAVHFIFTKPSGATVTAPGVPGNGKATYIIPEGLLNEAGRWRCRMDITLDSVGEPYVFSFEVRPLE